MTKNQLIVVLKKIYGADVMNQWVLADERMSRITLKWDGNYYIDHKHMRMFFDSNLECLKTCYGDEMADKDGAVKFVTYNGSPATALKADNYLSFDIISGFTLGPPDNNKPYLWLSTELQEITQKQKDIVSWWTK